MRMGPNTITYLTSDMKAHTLTGCVYYPCMKRKMHGSLNFVKVVEGLYRVNVNMKCMGINTMIVFEDGVLKKTVDLVVNYMP